MGMRIVRKSVLGLALAGAFGSSATLAFGQDGEVTITGTVLDNVGTPVVGAAVVEQGTTNGTVTDVDGRYSVTVSQGATLTVSFLGYETVSQALNGTDKLDFTIFEESSELDELIVVGYGMQKKSDVTGSVTSISKDRLENLPVTNVLQAVQGAAAGVTITQGSSIPGDAPTALVRGRNSINASTGPYVVVDGVPINNADGSLNDINPNDIESVEILKDASATAIYGTNGANGVILVTTKHGKSGKAQVRYAGYAGVEGFAKKLEFCDGAQITQRYKDYVAQNKGETMYNEYVKNIYEADNQKAGKEIDWVYDEVSRTGVIQSHNISISGGTEDVNYYISGDFFANRGVLKGYDYKRYSLRTNIDADVTKWLTIGTNTYIVSHNRDGGRVSLVMAEAMSPYGRMYEEDGSLCQYPMYSESLFYNPLRYAGEDHERRQWNVHLNGYGRLKFGGFTQALEGLEYKYNFGYAYVPRREAYYDGAEQNNLNGYAWSRNAETQSYTSENILSYNKVIADIHSIGLTGLYAASRKKYNEFTNSSSKFINDELSWHKMSGGETQTSDTYTDLHTTTSIMGRLNYSFDSRYLLTVSVRRDGSSVFGANNKYGTFPSLALGWNIYNESFMESMSDAISNMKLRLSFGKAGNEAISVYETISKMSQGTLAMDGQSRTALWPNSRMGNNDLSWETTKTFNIGLDFGFLNQRFNGTIDFYKSKTTDLLLQRNLPKLSGYNNVYANMGETANTGLEFTINSKNLQIDDFSWTTNLVFSWNKNEIKELYGDGKDDRGNRWFIGEPISVIFDYTKVGIWQEDEIAAGLHKNWDPEAEAGDVKLADLNKDGKIDDDDRSILGQTTPKWTGGMTNTFAYKGLSLSIFFQTAQGHKRNNSLLAMASDEMGRRNSTTEVGYWTPENKSNEYRSLSKTSNRHGYGYPCDAGYTRLKDITLNYVLPNSITEKMGVAAMNVYASGRNLATFTDWKGWDPEADIAQRGHSGDGNNYPMTRSFVIGLNITFK